MPYRIPVSGAALPATLLVCLLSACASYQRAPLPERNLAPVSVERVTVDPRTMPLPELATHRYDPSDGLDMTETAMLAVVNNPDLRLARDDLGIARAQAFAAGLLPDPQLSASSNWVAPSVPASTTAFNVGATIDVMAILLGSSNEHAANANVEKIDLGLLWQEWQIVAQARQLFIRATTADWLIPLLEQQASLNRQRLSALDQALALGATTQDLQTAALIASDDADKALADARLQRWQVRRELIALLGLAPNADLRLIGAATAPDINQADIESALATLPSRRPDLLALQAGYEAQDEKYRAAIIAQFPSLSVGYVRARDNSNVYTNGLQINLSLPVFNRNRGNIAIELATRSRMRDEYAIRLNQAEADVARIHGAEKISERHLLEIKQALPQLAIAAQRSRAAFDAHDISLNAYVDAQSIYLTRKMDVINLEESLGEQRLALQVLLGGVIPDAVSKIQISGKSIS